LVPPQTGHSTGSNTIVLPPSEKNESSISRLLKIVTQQN
jgi:hypothetical protein